MTQASKNEKGTGQIKAKPRKKPKTNKIPKVVHYSRMTDNLRLSLLDSGKVRFEYSPDSFRCFWEPSNSAEEDLTNSVSYGALPVDALPVIKESLERLQKFTAKRNSFSNRLKFAFLPKFVSVLRYIPLVKNLAYKSPYYNFRHNPNKVFPLIYKGIVFGNLCSTANPCPPDVLPCNLLFEFYGGDRSLAAIFDVSDILTMILSLEEIYNLALEMEKTNANIH